MMRAWLADWGASTSAPTTVMAWMAGTDEHGEAYCTLALDSEDPDPDAPDPAAHVLTGTGVAADSMPGYASADELTELSTLTGAAQGRRWIELMRAHHVGGVAMATAATRLASSAKVVRLATQQAATQTFEISQYDMLLAGTDA